MAIALSPSRPAAGYNSDRGGQGLRRPVSRNPKGACTDARGNGHRRRGRRTRSEGRPSFNLLQNYGSVRAPLHFFIFDILILKGEDVMGGRLVKRRQLLEKHVLPKLDEPIRYSRILNGSLKDPIHSVKARSWKG